MNVTRTTSFAVMISLCGICLAQTERRQIPTVAELAQLLIDRSQTLNDVDVTYEYEYEYLFPVAGLTPKSLESKSSGHLRTVFSGQRRRFERYPDNRNEKKYPSTLIIFDGNTTAEGHLKVRPDGAKAVSVFLRGRRTHQADEDCQFCASVLQKPLSDAALALSYDNSIFPYSLRAGTQDGGERLVQIDPQLRPLEGADCVVVRFLINGDSYWLDPKRDFALVRREMFATLGDKKILQIRSTAQDFQRYGDYWVPNLYVREHGAPPQAKERVGDVYYRVKLTLEKFTIGAVSDNDFNIVLDDGAMIQDMDSRQMLVNPTNRLAEVATLVAEVESKKRHWWWQVGGVIAAFAFVIWRWKTNRRKAEENVSRASGIR